MSKKERIIKRGYIAFMSIVLMLSILLISFSVDIEQSYSSFRSLTSSLWNSSLNEVKNYTTPNKEYLDFENFYSITDNVVYENDPTTLITNFNNQYIKINSAFDLYAFSNACNGDYRQYYLSYNYVLGQNIDYSDASQTYKFLKPIGWGQYKFTGSFDGQGFIIENMFYDRIESEEEYHEQYTEVVGVSTYELVYYTLFSEIGEGGIVKNLGIINPTMLQASIYGPMLFASSLIGKNGGTVEKVYLHDLRGNSGGLSAEGGFHVSSLLSYNNGTFKDCYVASNRIISSSVTYSSHTTRFPVIEHSSDSATIQNIYFDVEELSGTYTNNSNLATPLQTADFLSSEFPYFIDEVSNGWYSNYTYGSNYSNYLQLSYPILQGFNISSNTVEDFFEINSAANLVYFSKLINLYGPFRNASYLITKTIDMSMVSDGSYQLSNTVFSGSIESTTKSNDGYNYILSDGSSSSYNAILNLNITSGVSYNSYRCYGFIGILSGTIKNINIINANIQPLDLVNDNQYIETNAIGIICGKQEGGLISNVNVTGNVILSTSEDNSKISSLGKTYAGGAVGITTNGMIRQITTTGLIDGSYKTNTSTISNSAIGGVIGAINGAIEVSDVLNVMTVKAMRFESDNNTENKQFVGGVVGYANTNDCFKLENRGEVIIGESGKDYYYNNLYVAGVVGYYYSSTNNNGLFLNNADVTFYARHLTDATNCYISGVTNIESTSSLQFTNLSMRGSLNILNDVASTVTDASPVTSKTTSTMNLRASGVVYSINTNVELIGVYNLDSHYEYVNNQKVLIETGSQEIDLSIISEYAPCVVGDNTTAKINLKKSYNYRSLDYITTQDVKFYNLKLSGNVSGVNFILDNVRNDGDILVNFTKNANVTLNKYYNSSSEIDYKKLKVYGIFEENSVNCTSRNIYNGGDIEVTMTNGLAVYFNVYLSGICYKNDGGEAYFDEYNLSSTDVTIDSSVEGTLYNALNNGDLTISGTRSYNAGSFYGVTRVSGIASINSSIISSCFNLGNIYNCNYIVSANSTGGSYSGEFEVESGGICFLMLNEYAQIKDSANNGKVFSINTSTSSSWVNASGIVARNEKDEFGWDLSNSSCDNTNPHRQKIQYTINYGDIYSYNMQDDSYSNYEPRCKSGGFLSLGVCNIINVVNYGNISSTKVSGGMYGLVFIYKFTKASNTDGNRVYIANAINYGKVQAMTINSSAVPTLSNYSTFTQTTYADGSHPNGALIGYIANNYSYTPEVTLSKIVISYLINFQDDLNIVGRSYNISSPTSSSYETIRNTLKYMATTNPNDTSPSPFNKSATNNYGIKSYSKDISEPNLNSSDIFSAEYNGGIFNEKYGLRDTSNVDTSIETNEYISDYIQFIPYSKVNDYIIEKIGLSGTIFQTAYQTFRNNYQSIYTLLTEANVDPTKINTIYQKILSDNSDLIYTYQQQIISCIDNYLEETDDTYGFVAALLETTKGNFTQIDVLLDYAGLSTISSRLISSLSQEELNSLFEEIMANGDLSKLIDEDSAELLVDLINCLYKSSLTDYTTIVNIYNYLISDTTLMNSLSDETFNYLYTNLFENKTSNTQYMDDLYTNLVNSISDINRAIGIYDNIIRNYSDLELLSYINSKYGSLDEAIKDLSDNFDGNSEINDSLTTLSSNNQLISLATSLGKSSTLSNYGIISSSGTIYTGPYMDIDGNSVDDYVNSNSSIYYITVTSATSSKAYNATGSLSSANLKLSYKRNGSYSLSSSSTSTSTYLYGTVTGTIGSSGSSVSNIAYGKYYNYSYSTVPTTTEIYALKGSLDKLSSEELRTFWNKVLEEQGNISSDRNLYELIIKTAIYNDYNELKNIMNLKTTTDGKVTIMSTNGVLNGKVIIETYDDYITTVDDKKNIVNEIISNDANSISSSTKTKISSELHTLINLLKDNNLLSNDFKKEIINNVDPSQIIVSGLNDESLTFDEMKGILKYLAQHDVNEFLSHDEYLNDEIKKHLITIFVKGNQDKVDYLIDELYSLQITDLDQFMEFIESIGLSSSDYTDFTGIYALSSSLGIKNGEFIPDNIRLIDLDSYLEYDDNNNLINDPSWRGGTVDNPNGYTNVNGAIDENCVNYKVYYQMKQLKKSIATNVFKVELVDNDLSTEDETINYTVRNDITSDYDLENKEINFYVAINADELNADYLVVNTTNGSYELCNLASFKEVNKIILDKNSISVGDVLTSTFIVQAEDITVTSTYTVKIHITQAKSVTKVSSISVNGTSTSNYSGDINNYEVYTNVNASDGSIKISYETVNIPTNTDLKDLLKVFDYNTSEQVYDYEFTSLNNNGIVYGSTYNIIDNTWSTGSLDFELKINDSLPSGKYIIRTVLTSDNIYNIVFTKSASTNCDVLSITYDSIVYDNLSSSDSITTYIKYGTTITSNDLTNLNGSIPSYLDNITVSPLANFEITSVSVTQTNGIKTYQVVYKITAENSNYYSTFTHYITEYSLDTELKTVYINGGLTSNPVIEDGQYAMTFKKSETPAIRFDYDLINGYFTSDSDYLNVVYQGNVDEVGHFFTIDIDESIGITISFIQSAPSKEYVFKVYYKNSQGVMFDNNTHNTWNTELTTISITKDMNERSYLENATFISDTVLTSIDTIVTTTITTASNYTERKNSISRDIVCLPSGIYYGQYEYEDVIDKQDVFYIVGLVSKTNLSAYSPTFTLAENSKIYRIIQIDSVDYRFAPYNYQENGETKETYFLVNEDSTIYKDLEGNTISISGNYNSFTYNGIDYTLSILEGLVSMEIDGIVYENSSLNADFNPQVSDGVAEFNYIQYRVYAEKYQQIQTNDYYTDYYVAIQDVTNNVKFNITVIQDSDIDLSSYIYTYINFVNYQTPDDFLDPNPSIEDYSVLSSRMGMFGYFVTSQSELTHNTFKTSRSGRYDICLSLPKGYSFKLRYKDGTHYSEFQEASMLSVSIIIDGSILSKVVDIEIVIISKTTSDSDWGQNNNFDLSK